MEYSGDLYPPPRARIKSPIWGRFFGFPKNQQGQVVDDEYPICKACSRKVKTKGGNTSNLFVHLREHHPALHAELKAYCYRLKRVYAKRRAFLQASDESKELANEGECSPDDTIAVPRFRKHKFTNKELEVLIAEVTKMEDVLFCQGEPLTTREKYKIWFTIAERVSAASGMQRSITDVKRRWQDLNRRAKDRVVEVRRSLHLESPSSSSSSSSLITPSVERREGSVLNCHSLIKEEESSQPGLLDEIFCSVAVVPEMTSVQTEPQADVSHRPVTHSGLCQPTSDSTLLFSQPHIKEEVIDGPMLDNQAETVPNKDILSQDLKKPESGLRVSLPPPLGSRPSRQASLSVFEQQLLRVHREHTAAVREGFNSLARQNHLLYLELCETNKNVARIASHIAERAMGSVGVAEALLGVQRTVSESLDATNQLQGRVLDLLTDQLERPLVYLPQTGTNHRLTAASVETANC